MEAIITTPEVIIHSYIIRECLADIEEIKSLESSIAHDDDFLENDEPIVKKDGVSCYPEEWYDVINSQEFKDLMKANRSYNEERLRELKTRGSHSDGLQPILVLLGNISMIQQEVLKPSIELIRNDQHYKYDIELREIDATQVTKDFVRSLPKPGGKDGGILVIKSITKFVEMYDVTDQKGLICDIIANPIGAMSSGWRIIFLEETDSENIALNNSFVDYWTKGNLYLLFVSNDK